MLKLSYSKPFQNNLNYASTANIEEFMKFYNLGDKTFETDFRLYRGFNKMYCILMLNSEKLKTLMSLCIISYEF